MPVSKITASPAPGPTAAVTITPKEVLDILRRHIPLIVSLTILGLIVGGVAWYLLMKYAPKYTAGTYIKVLPPVEKDPLSIVERMAAANIQYEHRRSLVQLITRQSNLAKLVEKDKIQETEWFKSFGKSKAVSIEKAIKQLKKSFAAHAQKEADYISLSMTCGNKVEAALIVNEMVDLFLDSQRVTSIGEISSKLTTLNDQLNRIKDELADAEKALDAVRDTTNFTGFEQRQFDEPYTRKVNDLEERQNELLLQIERYQTTIKNFDRQATGPIDEQLRDLVERDTTVTALTRQIAALETELAGKLTKFGENHRVVQQIQEMMNQTEIKKENRKLEIAEQTRQANLKNAQDSLAVLQAEYEQLEIMRKKAIATKADYDLARILYERRSNIRDDIRRRREAVESQISKLKIMATDPETPKVKFVGYAPIPLTVSSPRRTIYFPGGTVLGFMFGIGLAFLIEILNDLVRTPRDVVRYLNIPLLGVVPDIAEDDQVTDTDTRHVVRQAPYSIIAESYRRLRANLKLSGSTQSSKALFVSSCMAGDGKTSVATNLATTLVAENKKVLLIDANFWQPALHTAFPKPDTLQENIEQSDFGLSNLLMGQCDYQKAIRPTGIEGFDIIDSGPLPSNPAELLGCAKMQELVKQQKENYNYVIVDGPPVLLVSDAKVLAKIVDATLLVFNAGQTSRGAAIRTIRELKEVNVTIAGCVLFAVKAMKGGYFQEQFRSYQKYQKLQLAHSV